MTLKLKKILTDVGVSITGFAMIGTFGAAALGGDEVQKNIEHTVPLGVEQELEVAAVETQTATEVAQFISFQKAGISEYDMIVATKKSTKKKKTEKPEQFKVELPDDSTTIYDPKPDALHYYETRSVAEEYYTVYDIMSGSTITMNAHEMLCQMVYSEIGATWDDEAIKSQLVAAYSYLRFCDSISFIPQVGLESGYPSKIENCLNAVEGQCVFYNGQIINAVYSASSAGVTVESEKLWGTAYPYLRAVVSEFDEQDPNYGLESEFTEDEVKKILENGLGIKLSDDVTKWFKVEERCSGKYIERISIDSNDSANGSTITGRTILNLFGLKSRAFDIEYNKGVFKFTSYGFGHGIGMSQWGACLYARNGYTYDQILRHYYLDTTIALSQVSDKAVSRGSMTQQEIDDEISDSEIEDENNQPTPSSSSETDSSSKGDSSSKTDEVQQTADDTSSDSADQSSDDSSLAN